METPKKTTARKLLVASLGVASVSYVAMACGKENHPITGNLPAPTAFGSEKPPLGTASASGAPSLPVTSPVTGNLPAPPPVDAGAKPAAADAGKAADGGKGDPKIR